MCVCSTIYGSIQKDFWSFYMFLKVIFFTLCVHVQCLLCFSLFKHVLCWKTGVRVFCDSAGDLPIVKPQSWVHPEVLATHLRLAKIFATEPRNSPSREMPRNSFLKGFLWETYFKPLLSSFKPIFHYFYIKTKSIWMVFHSINISKVIINSFHWFWSLDYVLESFVLLVGIFDIGVGKTLFLSNFLHGIGFFCWFDLDVGPLWQIEHVLRVDFMMFTHCFTLLFIVCTLGVW